MVRWVVCVTYSGGAGLEGERPTKHFGHGAEPSRVATPPYIIAPTV